MFHSSSGLHWLPGDVFLEPALPCAGRPPHAPVLSADISSSPRSGGCFLPWCGPGHQHSFNHCGVHDLSDCIHSWPLIFAYFLGEGYLEHEDLVPPCVGCVDVPACLQLAWGSLCGVDLSCISLEAHFSPSCLSLIPLFPLSSETVLSTGSPVRTGSNVGCHGCFRCWGGKLGPWAVSDQGLQGPK